MSETIISDRRASWQEVAAQRAELRGRADVCGLTEPRLRNDGAVIVHAPDAGYRSVSRFAAAAASLVGTYVQKAALSCQRFSLRDGVDLDHVTSCPAGVWSNPGLRLREGEEARATSLRQTR